MRGGGEAYIVGPKNVAWQRSEVGDDGYHRGG
jgi:hypothetical protein